MFPLWLTAASVLLVLLVVGVEAADGRDSSGNHRVACRCGPGSSCSSLVVWLVAATAPLALAANDTVDLMQNGREGGRHRALNAARDGDTITAQGSFEQAAQAFSDASEKLESPLTSTGLAVPFLASNVRAARTLAEIGTDLAGAGESLTTAVNPDALRVVDGRLPIDEVRKVTPQLEDGARRWRAPEPASTTSAPIPTSWSPCATRSTRCTGSSRAPTTRPRTRRPRPSLRRRSSVPRASAPTSSWCRTTPSREPPAVSSAATRS